MLVEIPLEGQPTWLAGLQLSRTASGNLEVVVIKKSGADYGRAEISRVDLLRLLDLLGVD
jgi:hypothetical protein